MILLKCFTEYVSIFGKPRSDHWTGKGQSPSQFPRREILKNVQTTRQFHSFPMLVRLCSKFSKLGFSITWTENFQMFKLGLEKAEEPEIKLPTFTEFQKNIYLCFIDYAKPFDCVAHNKLEKILREM